MTLIFPSGYGLHSAFNDAVSSRLRAFQDADTTRQTKMFQVYIVTGFSYMF